MLLSSSSLFYSVCLSSCERMLSVCIGVSHFFLFSVQHARVFYGIRNAPSRLQDTTFAMTYAITSLITVLRDQISRLKAWMISLSTRERIYYNDERCTFPAWDICCLKAYGVCTVLIVYLKFLSGVHTYLPQHPCMSH